MSRPRCILPGTSYLVTRRCSERRFLLRPDPQVRQLFRFCLARASARSGVVLHAYVAMSNHYHLVVTDPEGRLPEFQHWLDAYLAKTINLFRGRRESLWAPGSYSAVRLVDSEDIHQKLLYLYLNPVSAGLVRSLADWPGAKSLPGDCGRSCLIERPRWFFRRKGDVPPECALTLVAPAGVDVQRLERERVEIETELRRRHRQRGWRFLGARRVTQQSPNASPSNPEPTRRLNPSIAAGDRWRRIEALQQWKAFLGAYREAWRAFCSGQRGVRFPPGTYWMRVRFGVRCGSP